MSLQCRDEVLAGVIGQIIRLFAKCKSLSKCFQNFHILNYLIRLMQNEQFVISGDAQQTFEAIMKGARIEQEPEVMDSFINWIDENAAETYTHEFLNQMFYDMRQSTLYGFKRICLKIQYEILSLGLKQCMIDISAQYCNSLPLECDEAKYEGIMYYKFSKFFVENKYNLKDIMIQISQTDEQSHSKYKEQLFLLLSFFILTYEYRHKTIRTIIFNNRDNFKKMIEQFDATIDDEDCSHLLRTLCQKLDTM